MTIFGVHTNAQGKPLAELIAFWRHVDDLGFGWISVTDHFPGSLELDSNDAVVAQTALACHTKRAHCGVLVYSIGFRHPAVLASAARTVDHLSDGRAAIGLGAGSSRRDYEIHGFRYPDLRERMDMLDEGVQCVRAMLHGDVAYYQGAHFSLSGAPNGPRPVQQRLPIWVGTAGEQRGLRIAAQHADGWNLGFPTPEVFTHKRSVLHRHCESVGRDPADITSSVNIILAMGEHRASIPTYLRSVPALLGTPAEVVDQIAHYVDAGADQINFCPTYPWDYDGFAELAALLELPAA